MDLEKKIQPGYALVEITEMIKESIDSGKFGCGIFIDLRKSFDTVNHEILLTKLEHGIMCNMLDCFKSYLSNPKDQSLVTILIY